MKFDLSDAKENIDEEVVVNTIDDLKAISETNENHMLVIDFGCGHFKPSIIIYNDYLE